MEIMTANTIQEIINECSGNLEKNEIEDARLNVELIAGHVLNYDRINLYLNFEKPVTEDELNTIETMIFRRINHEPLQYILGETNFFGYRIFLNRNVLIPRPETEVLVENFLEDIFSSGKNMVKIFEIGTGSGCIAIAIAKELEKKGIEYKIVSIDKSTEALKIARENCIMNEIDFEKLNLIEKDFFEISSLKGNWDYIISNPPYISKDDFQLLQPEIKDHEPQASLSDGNDGLDFYRKLYTLFNDSDFKGKVFCEFGFGQKQKLQYIFKGLNIDFYNDLSGIERIIKISK
jgi:release factor glutamine methyltransferase